jgi:hypothetical protein
MAPDVSIHIPPPVLKPQHNKLCKLFDEANITVTVVICPSRDHNNAAITEAISAIYWQYAELWTNFLFKWL